METSKESIRAVFDSFDKDHSGFIDFTEIIKVAQELGQQISQVEVKKVKNSKNLKKLSLLPFFSHPDFQRY